MTRDFYLELKSSLAQSARGQKKSLATNIVDENILISSLTSLLSSDQKTTNHFLWLIADVALQNPQRFLKELPELFDYFEKNYPDHLTSFASWWHYCGVPEEHEAKAIDYLFKWILSSEVKPYIKTRALWVLVKLSEKYPELKQELKLCLADQMDKYSKDFQKRARKILDEL